MFFANDLLLTIYFIFILDYGNDVTCCCSVTKTCPTLCDPLTAALNTSANLENSVVATGNDVRFLKNDIFSYLSSKWVIKQWGQLATSTPCLAQKLLTNVYCTGGSRSFAKETRVLKVRRGIVTSHGKLTTTIESNH